VKTSCSFLKKQNNEARTKNALTDWKPFEENSFPNHCNGKNNPPASDFPAVLTVQVFSDFELPAIGRNPTNRRQSHCGWTDALYQRNEDWAFTKDGTTWITLKSNIFFLP
jgi:hypothetical protein